MDILGEDTILMRGLGQLYFKAGYIETANRILRKFL
jgi:hypothetical protein